MCTTAAKKINENWFLIKSRDPVPWMRWDDEIKMFDEPSDKYRKLIVQNPDAHEDGYYGGINEKGVALVATFVHVAENQIPYLRKPYIRLILDAASAKEAVKIIQGFNPHIGGNMFVADKNECYGIEAVPEKYSVEKINSPAVKTNHFLHLPNKNIGMVNNPEFEAWSKAHQARAEELISKAENVEQLEKILQDRKNSELSRAICTTDKEDKCYTYSAFIFDTKNAKAYYCQGNPTEKPFKEYNFTK